MTIQIELNGQAQTVTNGHTLQDLIDTLQLTGQALAVAVNRQVISRQKWGERTLEANDRVDVVRAIGGG
ncbi:sulfur carrier protein ThiS [Oxalobacter vibrioformis]|uniref:Sulfur carrier protein ThiS n=1 Tax=Oxalobacter vibrioformis TaxID=933080 RepID=A0A9E9M0Q8_9BURK|nr:sulfur carrier protein ThiS [Oxalobacter vibrioformis]NLC23304.1 sulfur carrier protein ThiS [Oxalobacter sp.]WAW11110.1 sulfur carrier protein ThiS [Oxalobacter vibrioformis]